ncbi:MAG TPA: hypothetical protein VFO82_02180 [Steroidobacteraceae bacterium]|jgi:hypothetical protein|nr:hypothetical protein [Steroidobacteraceae bacterium]
MRSSTERSEALRHQRSQAVVETQEIMQALADLAEERPDAVEVLRGRTFARAFH